MFVIIITFVWFYNISQVYFSDIHFINCKNPFPTIAYFNSTHSFSYFQDDMLIELL